MKEKSESWAEAPGKNRDLLRASDLLGSGFSYSSCSPPPAQSKVKCKLEMPGDMRTRAKWRISWETGPEIQASLPI